MKKIAVFADVQNIYYTTRQAYGRQFNYRKLWQQIGSGGEIVSATAYATHCNDDKQLKFQDALKHIGFTVKLKPYIQRSDGSAKGDWDVGITLDVMEAATTVDTVVLLSGDGDFDLFVGNLAHPRFIDFSDKSMLLRNELVETGEATFVDEREGSGLQYQETDSSPIWDDFDNDEERNAALEEQAEEQKKNEEDTSSGEKKDDADA